MLRYLSILTLCLFIVSNTQAKNNADTSLVLGRWDITVNISGKDRPSWLEVHRSGIKMLVGEFVADGGSARPISRVNFENGKLSFSIPPQWERQDKNLEFEGTLHGDSLMGTIILPDGRNCRFTAVKAPSLIRKAKPVWGTPIKLFNGKDLKGWHASGTKNQWEVKDGILKSPKAGSNIISDATFTDFKLHVEFRYPVHGNSGVYLRGRYEVQITDHYADTPPRGLLGSVYGFIQPNEPVITKPNEWITYDITLIGRNVTIVVNGKIIVNNQEIPGITGGALDSHEGKPGPIMLQGDHEPIEYRNIIITPAK